MGKRLYEISKHEFRKVILYRLLHLTIASGIGILISYSIAFMNAIRYNHPVYISSSIIIASIIICLIFLESIGFMSKKIDNKQSWNVNLKKRYWIQIFIITPYGILFGIIGSLFVTIFIAKDKFFDGFEILYFLLIGLVISLIYCNIQFVYYYLKRKKSSELNKLKFEKEDVEVKFQSLKEQLSPHFLFNNLNTLHTLIKDDTTLASDFVIKLSDIYRYVLQTKDNEIVTLKSEIEFIDKYLNLLKIRFGFNLISNIDVHIDFEKYYLPPLTLQILVENAQKHNHIDEDNPVNIDISNETDKYLVVTNNINRPVKSIMTLNSGLSNLKSRYKYLCDQEVEIFSTDTIFTVKVPLIQM